VNSICRETLVNSTIYSPEAARPFIKTIKVIYLLKLLKII